MLHVTAIARDMQLINTGRNSSNMEILNFSKVLEFIWEKFDAYKRTFSSCSSVFTLSLESV